jgi:hypothetical protein
VKGTFVGGLVAEIQTQFLFCVADARIVEAERLKTNGALLQSVMLGHAFHEQRFCSGCGLVFAVKTVMQLVKIFGLFARQEYESSGGDLSCGRHKKLLRNEKPATRR